MIYILRTYVQVSKFISKPIIDKCLKDAAEHLIFMIAKPVNKFQKHCEHTVLHILAVVEIATYRTTGILK